MSDWLERFQADFTVIKLELLDPKTGEVPDDVLQSEGQRLLDAGRRLLNKKAGGETLHAALTVYGKWIEEKFVDAERRVTQWGKTQGRHVAFMRKHLPDGPLAALGASRIDELLDTLRLRPVGDGGKAVSVTWTQNVLQQFRHFLRWLNRAQEFAWRRPSDLELGPARIPLSPTEKGRLARSSQVETYTPAELGTLWEYAPPFQRLVMLLGLNMYLSRRNPGTGQVQKVYLGSDAKADAAALGERRERREADRRAVETARSELATADDLMGTLDTAATVLLEATLLAAGFHRTNYGPWRKRRSDHGHGRPEAEATAGGCHR